MHSRFYYDGQGMSAGGSKASAAHEQDANAQNGRAHISASATAISGGAASAIPLDFRILTEPIAMRPNKGAYGVPFDLVDTSQGSAMSEMLQQLQEADTALTAMNIMNQSVQAKE